MNQPIQLKKNKQREVILLVDNRDDCSNSPKNKIINLKDSGFKQTAIDPLQFQSHLLYFHDQESIILNLKERISSLQKRVQILENQNNKDLNLTKFGQMNAKKKRRRFSELVRKFKCPNEQCGKIYGSETSLKNHLKLKHQQLKSLN